MRTALAAGLAKSLGLDAATVEVTGVEEVRAFLPNLAILVPAHLYFSRF